MSEEAFDLTRTRARVYALVRACPPGRVTTYGWLASAVGLPGHARLVGWIMNGTPAEAQVPAQRVVNREGVLTGAWAFGHPDTMAGLLRAEGVAFDAKGRVVMKVHGWDPAGGPRSGGIADDPGRRAGSVRGFARPARRITGDAATRSQWTVPRAAGVAVAGVRLIDYSHAPRDRRAIAAS